MTAMHSLRHGSTGLNRLWFRCLSITNKTQPESKFANDASFAFVSLCSSFFPSVVFFHKISIQNYLHRLESTVSFLFQIGCQQVILFTSRLTYGVVFFRFWQMTAPPPRRESDRGQRWPNGGWDSAKECQRATCGHVQCVPCVLAVVEKSRCENCKPPPGKMFTLPHWQSGFPFRFFDLPSNRCFVCRQDICDHFFGGFWCKVLPLRKWEETSPHWENVIPKNLQSTPPGKLSGWLTNIGGSCDFLPTLPPPRSSVKSEIDVPIRTVSRVREIIDIFWPPCQHKNPKRSFFFPQLRS